MEGEQQASMASFASYQQSSNASTPRPESGTGRASKPASVAGAAPDTIEQEASATTLAVTDANPASQNQPFIPSIQRPLSTSNTSEGSTPETSYPPQPVPQPATTNPHQTQYRPQTQSYSSDMTSTYRPPRCSPALRRAKSLAAHRDLVGLLITRPMPSMVASITADMAGGSGDAPATHRRAATGKPWHRRYLSTPGGNSKDDSLQGCFPNTGDLAQLDTMLDQLVVLDPRIRTALLHGPPISFVTYFPNPQGSMVEGSPVDLSRYKDNTFITHCDIPGGAPDPPGDPLAPLSNPLSADLYQHHRESAASSGFEGGGGVGMGGNYGVGGAGIPGKAESAVHVQALEFQSVARGSMRPPAPMPSGMTAAYGQLPTALATTAARALSQAPPTWATPPLNPLPVLDTMPPSKIQHARLPGLRQTSPPREAQEPTRLPTPTYEDLQQQMADISKQYTCGTSSLRRGQSQAAGQLSLPPLNNTRRDDPLPTLADLHKPPPRPLSGHRQSFVSLEKTPARPSSGGKKRHEGSKIGT